MVVGRPVVGTNTGGIAALVDHGRTGWLVQAESPERLADMLASFSQNQELLRSIGNAARAAAASHYEWSAVAERLKEALRATIARDQRSST